MRGDSIPALISDWWNPSLELYSSVRETLWITFYLLQSWKQTLALTEEGSRRKKGPAPCGVRTWFILSSLSVLSHLRYFHWTRMKKVFNLFRSEKERKRPNKTLIALRPQNEIICLRIIWMPVLAFSCFSLKRWNYYDFCWLLLLKDATNVLSLIAWLKFTQQAVNGIQTQIGRFVATNMALKPCKKVLSIKVLIVLLKITKRLLKVQTLYGLRISHINPIYSPDNY